MTAAELLAELRKLDVSVALDGDRLVPTPFAIRCYVAWTENGYRVLPGGLVRVDCVTCVPSQSR